jgi:hypothetical protein
MLIVLSIRECRPSLMIGIVVVLLSSSIVIRIAYKPAYHRGKINFSKRSICYCASITGHCCEREQSFHQEIRIISEGLETPCASITSHCYRKE